MAGARIARMAAATHTTPELASECECDWSDSDRSEHSGDDERQVHPTDFDEVDAPFDDEMVDEAGAELVKPPPARAVRPRSTHVRTSLPRLPDVLRPEPDTDDDAPGAEGGLPLRSDARSHRA